MLKTIHIQQNLQRDGYWYTGNLDGKKNYILKRAIKDFQKANDLEIDGIVGSLTNEKIVESAKEKQRLLNANGNNLVVDGILGQASFRVIKTYQNRNGLYPDGIIGTRTLKKLESKSLSWEDIKYFKNSEFKCDCGGRYCKGYPRQMNMQVVLILEKLREFYKQPIIITSGIRCKQRNREVGGVSNSKHLNGNAVDFYVKIKGDTIQGRNDIVKKSKYYGGAYAYANTVKMGNAVHVNI